ncbi:MAG: hypothetical protein ACI8SA_002601, partial [Dokdonia sp.]
LMKDGQVYELERDAIIDIEKDAYNALYKSLKIGILIMDPKK